MFKPSVGLLILTSLLGPNLISAKVFKHVDEQGNVTFSDMPAEGQLLVDDQAPPLPNGPIVPNTSTPSLTNQAPAPARMVQNGPGISQTSTPPSTQGPGLPTSGITLANSPPEAAQSPLIGVNSAMTSNPNISQAATPATPQTQTSASAGGPNTVAPIPIPPGPVTYDIKIMSPATEPVLQNDTQSIQLVLSISPNLQANDMIQAIVDGNPVGEPTMGTSLTIPWQPRGIHQITLQLIPGETSKNVLTTPPTWTFQQVRPSVLLKPK